MYIELCDISKALEIDRKLFVIKYFLAQKGLKLAKAWLVRRSDFLQNDIFKHINNKTLSNQFNLLVAINQHNKKCHQQNNVFI